MSKLNSLILFLKSNRFLKEAAEAESLQSPQTEKPWLTEWRDTMRHYGFDNFGDTIWTKGKSKLNEPLDKNSAEDDIHMVEQAHMPDEQGRRVSNDALDSFMKEFYGESITIAPREGWRSKMSRED